MARHDHNLGAWRPADCWQAPRRVIERAESPKVRFSDVRTPWTASGHEASAWPHGEAGWLGWTLENDLGSEPGVSEELEEERVRQPAIHDIRALDPALNGASACFHLGQHAALDDAIPDQLVELGQGNTLEQPAIVPTYARDVGEEDHFQHAERRRQDLSSSLYSLPSMLEISAPNSVT